MKPFSAQAGMRKGLWPTLATAIALAALAGCTSTQETSAPSVRLGPEDHDSDRPKPVWVTRGRIERYPLTQFMVGVGSSSAADASSHTAMRVAEDRARDAIARQIKVRIRSEFRSAAEIATRTDNDKTYVEKNRTTVAERINSQADLQLEGAEIVDQWYDNADRRYWAFAALDRSITGEGLLDRMAALRERMEENRQLGTRLRGKGRPYQALRHFNKALDDALGLLNYRAQLRVIAPAIAETAASASEEAVDFAALWKDIAETRQALRVGMALFVDVDGGPVTSTDAESFLSGALQAMRFNVSKPPAALTELSHTALKEMSPDDIRQLAAEDLNCLVLVRLSARYQTSEPIVKITVHFYDARAELLFVDLDTGDIAASVGFDYAASTHTGDKDRGRAAQEALSKAAKELSDRFKSKLEDEN